jgi:hypothetical protein
MGYILRSFSSQSGSEFWSLSLRRAEVTRCCVITSAVSYEQT